MKKLQLIVIGLCITMLVLSQSGCSNGEASSNQVNANQAENTKGNGKNKAKKAQNQSDASGEISSIDGTKFSLKLIEQKKNDQNTVKKERTFKANRNSPNPSSSVDPLSSVSTSPVTMKKQRQYTGEIKIVDLANISIQKSTNTPEGKQTSEISISELKVGDVLQLYYSDDAQSVLEKVSVGGGGGQKNGSGKKDKSKSMN